VSTATPPGQYPSLNVSQGLDQGDNYYRPVTFLAPSLGDWETWSSDH